ncbi:response regulator [Luteibacter yeojuensis]|uniref:Response regulator n=1 Tax=Luteibacter yeojuensis TaxID=345309 RepID=A0A7X5QUZ5_9GAMM|nr:response regulator [Luteibacter yeojuensis]NID15878.1 response regulator [Luteibacter yeojuensis]
MTIAGKETAAGSAKDRALVVDDCADLRKLFCLMLDELGFDAIEAANAHVALAILDTAGPFDLLLTDVTMPGSIDGSLLASMAMRRYPGMAIVVTTALPGESLEALPEEIALLPKPFYLTELASYIERARGRSSGAPPR